VPPARKNPPQSSLAGDASERVRAIIEAAETTAAQIRAAAEEDAERIRSDARAEAEALLGKLRQGVERLADELEIRPAPARVSAVAAEREIETPQPARELKPPAAGEPDEDRDLALAEDAAVGLDEAPEDADRESARLVALNMALDGAPREEVDRYLQENFKLSERASLLDEVYATVGR
jgi:hypothetical protein